MNMASVVENLKIGLTAKRVDSNPYHFVLGNSIFPTVDYYSHWDVTLTFDGRSMTVPYSMINDQGRDPNVANVIGDFIEDSLYVENAEDFADWAKRGGYNPKDKNVRAAYQAQSAQRECLIAFLGDEAFDLLCDAAL